MSGWKSWRSGRDDSKSVLLTVFGIFSGQTQDAHLDLPACCLPIGNFVMSGFQPHDDDVISVTKDFSLIEIETFTAWQFAQAFKNRTLSSVPDHAKKWLSGWFVDGVQCKFLSSRIGGGWKKGKIRLRLEFVPDEPEPEPNASDLVLSPNSEQQQ